MGGADFLALLLIGLAHPKFKIFPISLITLIISLIPPLVLMIYYALMNLCLYREFFKTIKCIEGIKSAKLLMILGKPVNIAKYLRSKFVYPLTIPYDPLKKQFKCRLSFDDEPKELKIKEQIKELVLKGHLKPSDRILITPALPHISFILLGYIVAVLIPQDLILSIISSLIK